MCCTFNPTGTLAVVGSTHAPYLLAWSLHDAHRRFAEARGAARASDGVLSSGQVSAEEELPAAGLEEGKYSRPNPNPNPNPHPHRHPNPHPNPNPNQVRARQAATPRGCANRLVLGVRVSG